MAHFGQSQDGVRVRLFCCGTAHDTIREMLKGVVTSPRAAPRNDEERSCLCGKVESNEVGEGGRLFLDA
jgi:hypothetical protein